MTNHKDQKPNSRLVGCDTEVAQAIEALITCFERKRKLLVCGNGGSAADAEHIVGEMMKGFCLPRRLSDTDKAQLASVAGDDGTYTGHAPLTDVLVTTKGGITRSEGEQWGRDSSPQALRRACEDSLRALDVSCIDLYQHHRHDPAMTYLDQVRALQLLKDEGLVRRIGLSNVTEAELDLAIGKLGSASDDGVVSVQNELSPRYRADLDVLARCEREGIAFLPWSPLGGATHAKDVGSQFAAFADVADAVGATPQEVTLAWLLRMSPVMIPIPGATRPETITSIVRSMTLELTDEQFATLQATTPEHTSMYPEDQPRSPLR